MSSCQLVNSNSPRPSHQNFDAHTALIVASDQIWSTLENFDTNSLNHKDSQSCRYRRLEIYLSEGTNILYALRKLYENNGSVEEINSYFHKSMTELDTSIKDFHDQCGVATQKKESIKEKLTSTAIKLKDSVSSVVNNFKPFESTKKESPNKINAAATRAAIIKGHGEHPITNDAVLKKKQSESSSQSAALQETVTSGSSEHTVKFLLQKHLIYAHHPTHASPLKMGNTEQLKDLGKFSSSEQISHCIVAGQPPVCYPELPKRKYLVACVDRWLDVQVYGIYTLEQIQAMQELKGSGQVKRIQWRVLEIPEKLEESLLEGVSIKDGIIVSTPEAKWGKNYNQTP